MTFIKVTDLIPSQTESMNFENFNFFGTNNINEIKIEKSEPKFNAKLEFALLIISEKFLDFPEKNPPLSNKIKIAPKIRTKIGKTNSKIFPLGSDLFLFFSGSNYNSNSVFGSAEISLLFSASCSNFFIIPKFLFVIEDKIAKKIAKTA